MKSKLLGLSALLLSAGANGCATDRGLEPAPGVRTLANNDSAAIINQQGIELVVDGDAWSGRPDNLEKEMTPVRVVVRNRGETPVLVQHRAFYLDGLSGQQVQARSPFKIDQLGPIETRIVPAHTARQFYVADYLSPFYGPVYPTWGETIPYAPAPVSWRPELPTPDMLNRALPEGVLEPGGEVEGFVYFPKTPARGEKGVVFRADLAAPKAGQDVAAVSIPFRVK